MTVESVGLTGDDSIALRFASSRNHRPSTASTMNSRYQKDIIVAISLPGNSLDTGHLRENDLHPEAECSILNVETYHVF